MERPTRSEIYDLLSEYQQVFSIMRSEMAIDQDYLDASGRWGKNLLKPYIRGFPKDFVIKSPPIAKLGVDIAVSFAMAGEVPEVRVSLPGSRHRKDETYEEHRTRMENWFKAFLYRVATQSAQNPFAELLRKQYGLGMGVLAFPFDWTLWPTRPEGEGADALEQYEREKLGAFPWAVSVVHPRNIYVDPYRDPPEHYLIEDQVALSAARRRYPHLSLGTGGTKVKRITYCSADWYAVYVAEQPALTAGDGADEDGVAPNPMGVLWYETAWSGLGDLDENAGMENLGKGLIRDSRDVLAMYTTNLNVVEAIKLSRSFSPLQISAPTVELAMEAGQRLTFAPLSLWATDDKTKANPVLLSDLPHASIWEQGEMNRLLELIFGPAILRGQFPEDTASGLRMRVSLAQTPFASTKVAAEQAIANMLRKIARFVKEELQESVSLPYRDGLMAKLDPEDILLDALIEVNLRPVTDEERAFNATRDRGELEIGAITMQEYRRRQGEPDDDNVEVQRFKDALRLHPKIVEAAALVVAQQIAPQQPAATPAEQPFGVPALPRQPVGDGRMPSSPQEGAQQRADKLFRVPVGA